MLGFFLIYPFQKTVLVSPLDLGKGCFNRDQYSFLDCPATDNLYCMKNILIDHNYFIS